MKETGRLLLGGGVNMSTDARTTFIRGLALLSGEEVPEPEGNYLEDIEFWEDTSTANNI